MLTALFERASTGSRALRITAGAALLVATVPAAAQRSNENALRSAEDAFGNSIGNESIGLYSPFGVRGFSPFAAGNVRLEGLYFDAVPSFNGRLIRGSTVRVGISALGYPFPAPTGIADFRLRLPGEEARMSLVARADSYGSIGVEVDGELPIIPHRLAVGGGAHVSRDVYSFNGSGTHNSEALIGRWRPNDQIEIIPFWSKFTHDEMDFQPVILTNGASLPPEIRRGRYPAQRWARYNGDDVNKGMIGQFASGNTAATAGIFRSYTTSGPAFSNLFTNVSPSGIAAGNVIVGSPDRHFASTSGELRASRSFREGPRLHKALIAARARDNRRRYGGSSLIDLGPVPVDEVGALPKPKFTFGAQTHDRVRQVAGGIGYEGRWAGVGELTLGLQRSRYQKNVAPPGRAEIVTKDSPWLYNAALGVTILKTLAVYAGVTRGLEESPVAPGIAVNRDEAPPAILTHQIDAGLRWTLTPKMKVNAGMFEVEKPYFSLDSARFYRRLGLVRHRGLELSFLGDITPRLNILAGAILLDALVIGEAEEAGLVGRRPVGAIARTFLISGEYRPAWLGGLSIDASLNAVSRQAANSLNTLFTPATETLNVGARYAWQMVGRPVTIRVQASNLLNAYSWQVQASNAFLYNNPRQLSLRLSTDL